MALHEVSSRLAVAQSDLEAAYGTCDHAAVSKGQVEALVGLLQLKHLKVPDLGVVGVQIGACKWALESEKHQVLEALAMAAEGGGIRAQLHNFEHIGNYFTESQWQALASSVVDFGQKAKLVADHCLHLCLRNPSEPTVAKLAALLLACVAGR